MGKYLGLEADIFSLLNSDPWKAENIKAYPSNFLAVNPPKEFIRVNIVSSGTGINLKSVSGVLIIEIYTSVGDGPNKASLIADKLDDYLQGKTFETNSGASTQLGMSTMVPNGVDKDNKSLHKSSYTISFNYFGVL